MAINNRKRADPRHPGPGLGLLAALSALPRRVAYTPRCPYATLPIRRVNNKRQRTKYAGEAPYGRDAGRLLSSLYTMWCRWLYTHAAVYISVMGMLVFDIEGINIHAAHLEKADS